MPLFDHRCGSCGHVTELLLRSGETAPGPCACGGPLTRLISAPADLKRVDAFHHKETFSDRDIASRGLTKYVNRGDGTYEKAAGSGADRVSRDSLLGP